MAKLVLRAATALGLLFAGFLFILRAAVLAAGPIILVTGINMISRPAAYIVTGLILSAWAVWITKPSKGGK